MGKHFNAKEILQKNGYRATLGRIQILELLAQEPPRTVTQIHALLVPKIDQVTLYRALETFVASGLVRRVDLAQGNAHYYELAETHHHHLVCINCGTVKEFDVCDFEKIADKALKQVEGFASIQKHAFELFGLCIPCSKTY